MANISKIDRKAEKEKQRPQRKARDHRGGIEPPRHDQDGPADERRPLAPEVWLERPARSSAGRLLASGPGSGPSSPPTQPFVQPFTRMTVKQPVATLNPRRPCCPTSPPARAAPSRIRLSPVRARQVLRSRAAAGEHHHAP